MPQNNSEDHSRKIPSTMNGHMQKIDGSYVPGRSLRVWRDFFPNARIHGADVDPGAVAIANEMLDIVPFESMRVFCPAIRQWKRLGQKRTRINGDLRTDFPPALSHLKRERLARAKAGRRRERAGEGVRAEQLQ